MGNDRTIQFSSDGGTGELWSQNAYLPPPPAAASGSPDPVTRINTRMVNASSRRGLYGGGEERGASIHSADQLRHVLQQFAAVRGGVQLSPSAPMSNRTRLPRRTHRRRPASSPAWGGPPPPRNLLDPTLDTPPEIQMLDR